jgi:hypothetical protein
MQVVVDLVVVLLEILRLVLVVLVVAQQVENLLMQ